MSEKLPERADVRQLRIQAKELLRSLKNGEILANDGSLLNAKLADAQFQIARKYGFESWPMLVESVEKPALVEKLKNAINSGDAVALEKLFRSSRTARNMVNEPIFAFGSHALMEATQHSEAKGLIPILIRYGANPNERSKWWAGGFSALDMASPAVADLLVEHGAHYDVWSAAAHGKIEILHELLNADPTLVNALGGDGGTPLHFASNTEVVSMLIERGANLEAKDIDHEGTPIQHQINRIDIVKALMVAGAKPDIFTAVILDDANLVRQFLDEDPNSTLAHIGAHPFSTEKSSGGHIYVYKLGSHKTPVLIAAERGCKKALAELQPGLSVARRLIVAAWAEDEVAVDEILSGFPNAIESIGSEARAITDAAQAGKTETVRLLLKAGVDPKTPGLDMGTALHVACWYGYADIVKLLVGLIPLDLIDAVHGSPPLGWAAHGAHWCKNNKGNYPLVVETLIKAGANVHAPANSGGKSMMEQAGSSEDVKKLLHKYGAK
jgi:Ankyrin repeats (3 copies)/Ankyrin repeat